MSEITISGRTFRIRTMAPRDQFHTMRRVAPVLGPLFPAAMALLDKEVQKEDALAELAEMIGPVSNILSQLPDEQLDYVLDKSLAMVDLAGTTPGQWHPIYVAQPRGAIRMYNDIDLATELQLVSEVLKVNMVGFFGQPSGVSASSLGAPTAPQPA